MSNKRSKQATGGVARAKKLSSEQLSEIGRKGASARWSTKIRTPKTLTAAYGSSDRPLRIGEIEIPCYVLPNGMRVISQTGVWKSLDMSSAGLGQNSGDRLVNFVNSATVGPFASDELRRLASNPIRFKTPNQAPANGYDATILPELCEAILRARLNEALGFEQKHIAKQAEILLMGFGKIGIIALIDEITGYQEIRDRDALQAILREYISDELARWVRTFPMDFFKEIYRLKGWNWNNGRMPPYVGRYVKDLVYGRLAPGVLEELERLNPPNENGIRKRRHHQFLTREVGHPALLKHLDQITWLARGCKDWHDYVNLVNVHFPRVNVIPDDQDLLFDED
jgi:hypothetical protein